MLVFKAKARWGGWQEKEVAWAQTASPFPLPPCLVVSRDTQSQRAKDALRAQRSSSRGHLKAQASP